ncbi:MAG: phospholipase D-like domain-containing protein, partial [Candidatus Dadabacteria bacterium]|nr:phospholipase D-like domain-containing protein [Candidatus Dadabacteria bacterium]
MQLAWNPEGMGEDGFVWSFINFPLPIANIPYSLVLLVSYWLLMSKASTRTKQQTNSQLVVVDNRETKVSDFLKKSMKPGNSLSIVSAYFSIYGYEVLKDKLDTANKVRFLFGDPSSVESVDPEQKELNPFFISEAGLEAVNQLNQKSLAKECAKWIEEKAEVKSVTSNFVHGKMYHIQNGNDTIAISGSSNFTKSGLGEGVRPNIEINVVPSDSSDREALKAWFDKIWNNSLLVQDVKKSVLGKLEKLYEDQSPEFIYFKTLFHIFNKEIKEREKQEISLKDVHLYDHQIWKKLYKFQKEGAKGIINKLRKYNGCILADSVGLGKTYTALAVIKYFELIADKKVLVLCPRKLSENWNLYRASANYKHNPFTEDKFSYSLLAHTDLGRESGQSGEVNLSNFNWGNFGLVVIDESHNFRNAPKDRKDEEGNIIKRSRYNQLIEEVIKKGSRTKVLMLSATPVNTALTDLRNQIELMTEANDKYFSKSLKITSLKRLLNEAQKQFKKWESVPNRNKSDLLKELGADFLRLIDGVSIARSRKHIKRHYVDSMEEIGGFPKHENPQNEYPQTDTQGELSYEDLNEKIEKFALSVYLPSKYLID